jgi:hypothetical protein
VFEKKVRARAFLTETAVVLGDAMEQNTQEQASVAMPYEAPGFEVISLSCEISAYAPDDQPLF